MRRLMCVAPAQRLDLRAVTLFDPDQGIVQRQPRHIGAGLDRRALDHITPDRSPVDIAVDPLDEQRLDMGEFIG